MAKQILTLIRGLPGSGKSTIAKAMAEASNAQHIEADDYFCRRGAYEFDPRLLKDAHAWCLAMTKELLDAGYDVIVANTFTQRWELAPYMDLDEVLINVIEAKGEFGSTHNVPEAAIQRMRERWEEY